LNPSILMPASVFGFLRSNYYYGQLQTVRELKDVVGYAPLSATAGPARFPAAGPATPPRRGLGGLAGLGLQQKL